MATIILAKVTDSQYRMIEESRLHQDELMWQTPVLSLTGQAFLFVIAFGDGPQVGKLIASALILITSLASLQLMAKHRALEKHYSILLTKIETAKKIQPIHQRPKVGTGPVGWSSYR